MKGDTKHTVTALELARYLNCECEISSPRSSTIWRGGLRSVGLEVGGYALIRGFESKQLWHVALENVKPVLRSLSRITEEEASYIWYNILGWAKRDNIVEALLKDLVGITECPIIEFPLAVRIADYLRSRSIDMDGLIRRGLAIEDNTPTHQ